MSLLVRTTYAGEFKLNVTDFQSSLTATMMDAQTRKYMVYFPVKTQQPDIEFNVQFASINDYLGFQAFVRTTHLNALANSLEPGITLWWPERNILNWSGVIRGFAGGLSRFNYAPRARFTVDLIDSLVSSRTQTTSTAPLFDTIYGWGSSEGVMKPPTAASGGSFGGVGGKSSVITGNGDSAGGLGSGGGGFSFSGSGA